MVRTGVATGAVAATAGGLANLADDCALRDGEGGGMEDAADLGEGCETDAPPGVDGEAAAPDRRGTMEGLNFAPPFSIRDDMLSPDGTR